jgi:hypothetical protein
MKYVVSDKHDGPWLGESDKPEEALAKGRALWGDTRKLYVAQSGALDITEAVPSVEVFIGDMREKLVEDHGSGADAVFDNKKVMLKLSDWWKEVMYQDLPDIIDMVEKVDFLVVSKVRVYSPGNDVKVGDFK